MDHSALIVFGSIVVAGMLCLIGWRSSRRKFINRELLPAIEVVRHLPPKISRETAIEVLVNLEESFGLQRGVLRLDDPVSRLTDVDSWKLGEGQQKFEAWLKERGVDHLNDDPTTVGDLVVAIAVQIG